MIVQEVSRVILFGASKAVTRQDATGDRSGHSGFHYVSQPRMMVHHVPPSPGEHFLVGLFFPRASPKPGGSALQRHERFMNFR